MRRTLIVFGWLVAVGFAGVLGLLVLGVSRPVPVDWVASFVPYVFLPVWLLVVVALVLGSRSLAVGAAVVAAGHLALVLPAMSGGPDVVPPGATSLRLVTANLYEENPDLGPLLDEIAAADADVVVLQEFELAAQPEVVARLSPLYAHRSLMARDDSYGGAVFSRLPLVDEQVLDVAGFPMLTIGIGVGDQVVRLWDVHTRSPTLGERRYRRDLQLRAMADLRRFEHQPLVIAGDFNASYWNDAFADLLAADLRDAHDVVGAGLRGSWKGLPLETLLDHVLVSPELGVTAVRNGHGQGSDHRPVVADLFVR